MGESTESPNMKIRHGNLNMPVVISQVHLKSGVSSKEIDQRSAPAGNNFEARNYRIYQMEAERDHGS